MKKEMLSSYAPEPIGPYSQGILTESTIYLSGQLPIDALTGNIGTTIEEQTKLCLENLNHILNTNNMDMSNIVKTTIFLDDISDFVVVNDIYGSYFTAPFPARSTIQVEKLPKDALIEIEAIAVK
ncbi:RidA family protein [Vagococcus salmoninarum]|uniref:Reactive intermediate/imine deaminase n=1 Tax=Vagococcus salmoninarum TaxID=2739 RepID=A0A429ZU16_9ENTE|nr:Rid family detoxifying hydrolase [Vagococcus salmoninarum]RST97165.1 reactive intermediate/imine deaminase [Vagococcus salmoninarum]